MRKILSCEFNLDTACVELRLDDGTLLSIDCTAVENEVANSMYQRSELDWLIYNDPLAYAELILNGNPGKRFVLSFCAHSDSDGIATPRPGRRCAP